MDLFRALEEEKIALVDELDAVFPSLSIENIARIPEAIDYFLIEALKRCVVKYSPQLFHADQADVDGSAVMIEGATIHIDNTHNFEDEQNLIVAMLVHNVGVSQEQRKLKGITTRLRETGAYSTVTFQVPTLLSFVDEEWLKQITVEIFSVGYSWMNERIITGIRNACEGTNRALYEYLRIMVPDKQALGGFIFSAATNDKDFVILDDVATRSSLILASENAKQLGRSAADITLQMMLEVVPMTDSAIRDAVQSDSGIEIDLRRDAYYQRDNSFSQSLRAVWGDTVACFPIVTEGQFFLVAFYMPKYKAVLEPLLTVHKERLKEIAKGRGKEIKINLDLVDAVKRTKRDRVGVLGDWAEIIGRFMGGVYKGHHS